MQDIKPWFTALDNYLTQYRDLWQLKPFAMTELPWLQSYPQLSLWLERLSENDVAELVNEPKKLAEQLATFIPDAMAIYQLSQLSEVEKLSLDESIPRFLDSNIPGRKWQQITAFNQALSYRQAPWLEWCAGKGHLGRVLAASSQQSVDSVEWQQVLCEEGRLLADKFALPMHFIQADAFSDSAKKYVKSNQHAVALHACGDLHKTLLQHCCDKQTLAVSISPCCYHLIQDSHYQPLSDLAKASPLLLSKLDLKMPLHETVTAGAGVRRKRELELSFRLGFDSLQRHLTGSDDYLPVPSFPKAILTRGFTEFVEWAAEKKRIDLPDDIDVGEWLKIGEERVLLIDKIELIRQLFRRPLEIWLALDRANYLQQHGYQVSLATFCQREMTPRNIIIQGVR
ncbi:SAM-dependent methyltransferase [Vibrio sp. SS-MA-C1-2]|uniref:methyltransferase n=1 Tax=Vibrio sp. SS-MA-C1-2 TaxID=2908646 RepID=UPI001F18F395|nr:methyltransferase [Vibrio sp. SS-MA-C1-2]UJF19837.1 SAM-dependent methyltransferase [Vibrio sp. SS-MA-C1-2]